MIDVDKNKYKNKMKSTYSGMYKKGRIYDDGAGSGQNSEYNSSRVAPPAWTKKRTMDLDERNWMGSPDLTNRSVDVDQTAKTEYNRKKESPETYNLLQAAFMQNTPKSSSNSPAKAPTQLIQQILKGLSDNKLTKVNPYYDEESEEKLTEILTSKSKLEAYIVELNNQIVDLSPEVAKNYQMLIILLKHLSKSDIQVKHSSKGLQLDFNRRQMVEQENQIDRLEKKIAEKDEHIKEIIQEYQSVVRNFQDVIENLINEKESTGPKGDNKSLKISFNENYFN